MAELKIYTNKIQENIRTLSSYFREKGIQWSLVTKVFSGDKEFLKNVLTQEVIDEIYSIGDSRLTSLKNLKAVNPEMRTIYIKPPAKIYASEVVRYADISLNSSFSTIKALNEEARKQGKVHQIIIMIELGELREGVKRSDIMAFYEKVFDLPNIEVIGLGSNLGCMYGIEPTYDKLLQLSLYKELISARFQKELSLVSGGTSITLPLIENKTVPKEINHFRVGEAAFFGLSPLNNEKFINLNTDTFEFQANIIELEEKKIIPDGVISDGHVGQTAELTEEDVSQTSYKAILDFGLLDLDKEDIESTDPDLTFVGITSDMIVVDIGKNRDGKGKVRYQIGDKISFKPNYMAVARLLNSKFIDKVFINS
ncbi:MAG: alanine/ornithine racemase family PLP-dependent enzyme [Bacteroidetes bacterium]|nr:MAG: alanine/ornithine racemase family PLP-dependent enzyme [Bacteroidota bacterium]